MYLIYNYNYMILRITLIYHCTANEQIIFSRGFLALELYQSSHNKFYNNITELTMFFVYLLTGKTFCLNVW